MAETEAETEALAKLVKLLDSHDEGIALGAARTILVDRPQVPAASD